MNEKTLKEKILEGITVDYKDSLEKNFNLAKQFIRITKEGRVDVLVKEKLIGTDKILLYFIGKLYSKEAGLSPTDYVTNKELSEELGININSVLPWLKDLRDRRIIHPIKDGVNVMSISFVEQTLKRIESKVSKQ